MIHLKDFNSDGKVLCGLTDVVATWQTLRVTCPDCKKEIERLKLTPGEWRK